MRIDLIAADDIQESAISRIPETIASIFDTAWFKACVAAIAALTIFLVVLRVIQSSRHKKLRTGKNRKIRR